MIAIKLTLLLAVILILVAGCLSIVWVIYTYANFDQTDNKSKLNGYKGEDTSTEDNELK